MKLTTATFFAAIGFGMPESQEPLSAHETVSLTQVLGLLDQALAMLDHLAEDLAAAHLAGARDIVLARLSRSR